MGNKNSSNSKVFRRRKVSSTDQHAPKQIMMRFRSEQGGQRIKGSTMLRDDEYIEKHKIETPLDNDETFSNFIRRAKYRIRTVTMSKSNTIPAALDHEVNICDSSDKENYQREQFDDFIQIAKKKMRATSGIRNNSFLKKP